MSSCFSPIELLQCYPEPKVLDPAPEFDLCANPMLALAGASFQPESLNGNTRTNLVEQARAVCNASDAVMQATFDLAMRRGVLRIAPRAFNNAWCATATDSTCEPRYVLNNRMDANTANRSVVEYLLFGLVGGKYTDDFYRYFVRRSQLGDSDQNCITMLRQVRPLPVVRQCTPWGGPTSTSYSTGAC